MSPASNHAGRLPVPPGYGLSKSQALPGAPMEFFGMPDVTPAVFVGLCASSMVTAFLGVSTGAAGGLLLLAIMATVLPPLVLIPIHTVVQLGSGVARTLFMWRHVMVGTLAPFLIGAVLGAIVGAHVFIALPLSVLQGIL